MKALVYYSMSGNVRETAEKIAAITGARLIELKPVKTYPEKGFRKFFHGGMKAVFGETPVLFPYSFDASLYDEVIIGFPIWAGRFAPPLKTFLTEHKADLADKKIAAFACSSGGNAEKALASVGEFLNIEQLPTLSLTDPKTKPNRDNDAKIKEFCGQL